MYKKWNNDERRAQVGERKWLETYRPPSRVSERYLYPVPEHVYAGVGGFAKLQEAHDED